MADPKNSKPAAKSADEENTATNPVDAVKPRDTSSTGTVNKAAMSDPKSLSSEGAELSEEAELKGDVLDAGGPYVSEAPRPTPAAMVSYPSTGGLPDTGPNSKYVRGSDVGPKLFNENGERVDRDGVRLDDFGDRMYITDAEPAQPDENVPASIRAEMDAGKKALNQR